ncbi:MAG: hypothetical protein QOK21_472 [Solirubrobacteraceae bacterium]|nr:hypothetical protein [Solirubrobacteraceae bacterium]
MAPMIEQAMAGRTADAPAAPPAALLFATVPDADGGCAALLRLAGQTLAERLVEQLARLGIEHAYVVTRREWERDVAAAVPDAAVSAAGTLSEQLAVAAEIAEGDPGTLVLLAADVAMHGEALAGLLDDPRMGTGALVAREDAAAEAPFGVEIRHMRVIAAESPFHAVTAPTARFLDVLKVGADDRATLAGAARELAGLVAARPDGWDAELERKAAAWDEPARVAAARGDAVALLLVGLTRAGAAVEISRLRELVWARPISEAAAAAVAQRIELTDEDRLRLDSAVKATDGVFTTLFVSPYSRHLARFAARRGLTPNQVTTASMLTGLAAAALFAVGPRWALIAGAVLLQAAFTLDCVDGQLARYTRRFSRFGAWLDSVFDRAKEYAAYGGLAIGASRLGDPVWVLAGAALSLQTVRHVTDFSFAVRRAPDPILQPPLAAVGTPPSAGAAQRSVLNRARRLDAVPVALWAKKLIGFPIGERFAVISLTAALFTPRATFVVVLAWGGLAALYGLAGRVARAVASRGAAPVPERERVLRLYRDDGRLAVALGSVAAPWVRRIPPALLVVAGVVPVLVLIAASGAGASRAGALAALAWMVLLAGASAGASHAGPTAWAAPPAIRLGEYAGLLWLAAIAGAEPAAFAVLGALAFRSYDLIYRPMFQGRTPARWVGAIALGWDIRLVLAGALLAAGALEAGFFAWAAVIGAAFTAEAAMSWRRVGAPPGLMTDDEEDEGP